MSSDDRYYVYVMSNVSRTLYIGVTNDPVRRVWQHKQKESRTAVDDLGGNHLLWSMGVLAYQLLHYARTVAIRTNEQVVSGRKNGLRECAQTHDLDLGIHQGTPRKRRPGRLLGLVDRTHALG